MRLNKTCLAVAVAVSLAGCIDSGSDDTDETAGENSGAERISFTGLVADGYLRGATVCIDENENKECDPSEPSTVSGEKGAFSFSGVVSDKPILMVVVEGETIDEDTITDDNPSGTPFSKPLTLSAPAGYTNVTPLSTMVQNEVESGSSAADAEAAVKAKLGTTQDLDSDYIAAADDDTLTEEEKAEFLQMQQVAQVTARVISDNMETLEDAAAANSISLDDLISAIVDEVFDALDAISETVEENSNDFNPDEVAQAVNQEEIGLNPDNIDDVVEQNQAEEAATTANLATVIQNGGLTWAWAEIYNGMLESDYGTISIDGNGDFQETVYVWDGTSSFVEDTSGGNSDVEYVLDDTGWIEVTGGDTPSSAVAETDGTITLNFGSPSKYSERLSGLEVDLTGLNMRTVMNSVDDGEGIFGDYLDQTATFTSGAKGFTLTDAGSDEPYLFEDWGDCEEINKVNGFCNFAYVQNGPVDGKATSFAEITSGTKYTLTDGGSTDVAGVKGVEIGYGDTDKLWAEIVQDGTVNYYAVNQSHDGIALLGTSTWSAVAINTAAAIELVAIPEIRRFESEFDDGGNPVLGLISGNIRNAVHNLVETNQTGGINVINSVARDQMITNFSLDNYIDPNEVADKGCETGNYKWDENMDPTGSTLKTEADFDAAVTTCLDGAQFVTPVQANLVDTTFIAKNGLGDTVITLEFNGLDATTDATLGTLTTADGVENFHWDIEADAANDDTPTGRLVLNIQGTETKDIEIVLLSQDAGNTSFKIRDFNDTGAISLETTSISSMVAERRVDRARSTMADLAAAGILDDSNIDDGGNREGYIAFTDDQDDTGSITIYERLDPETCFTKDVIPVNDNGDGNFTAVGAADDGSDINITWYIDANGNLYDDQWTNVPADPQPDLSAFDSNLCP